MAQRECGLKSMLTMAQLVMIATVVWLPSVKAAPLKEPDHIGSIDDKPSPDTQRRLLHLRKTTVITTEAYSTHRKPNVANLKEDSNEIVVAFQGLDDSSFRASSMPRATNGLREDGRNSSNISPREGTSTPVAYILVPTIKKKTVGMEASPNYMPLGQQFKRSKRSMSTSMHHVHRRILENDGKARRTRETSISEEEKEVGLDAEEITDQSELSKQEKVKSKKKTSKGSKEDKHSKERKPKTKTKTTTAQQSRKVQKKPGKKNKTTTADTADDYCTTKANEKEDSEETCTIATTASVEHTTESDSSPSTTANTCHTSTTPPSSSKVTELDSPTTAVAANITASSCVCPDAPTYDSVYEISEEQPTYEDAEVIKQKCCAISCCCNCRQGDAQLAKKKNGKIAFGYRKIKLLKNHNGNNGSEKSQILCCCCGTRQTPPGLHTHTAQEHDDQEGANTSASHRCPTRNQHLKGHCEQTTPPLECDQGTATRCSSDITSPPPRPTVPEFEAEESVASTDEADEGRMTPPVMGVPQTKPPPAPTTVATTMRPKTTAVVVHTEILTEPNMNPAEAQGTQAGFFKDVTAMPPATTLYPEQAHVMATTAAPEDWLARAYAKWLYDSSRTTVSPYQIWNAQRNQHQFGRYQQQFNLGMQHAAGAAAGRYYSYSPVVNLRRPAVNYVMRNSPSLMYRQYPPQLQQYYAWGR